VAELTRSRIDAGALAAAAARPECGAVLAFLGTTRNHHDGRAVVRLEYEAYERMALEALERIEREACARFAILSCVIVHRLGEVAPSEASVVVVVAAVHRGPVFDAGRWAMDELKRTAPIWKKERFADGGGEWVGGTPLA
jgi:molybdopterin synthase catalytic subunit